MDFPEPLSLLDYYLAKLEWRYNLLFNQIWEIYDELGAIKEVLEYNASPRPPQEFDPLQTIWMKVEMSQLLQILAVLNYAYFYLEQFLTFDSVGDS